MRVEYTESFPSYTIQDPTPAFEHRNGVELSGIELSEWLAKEFVILGMRSDPEPLDSLWNWNAKSAVMNTDPDAAEAPAMYGFES